MSMPEHPIHPEDLIEPFLDGTLSPAERDQVLNAARSDAGFARRLALARDIRETLRSMPSVTAPPDLVPDVIGQARREARADALARIRSWFSALDLRPALATALLVVVIVAAGLLGRPSEPEVTPEAAQALADIKWTLGLVSEVNDLTVVALRDEVLEPHVFGSMQDAMNNVFQEPPSGRRFN